MSAYRSAPVRPPVPTLSRLPPLTALRAFVATARHLSFVGAADELHVTSAAIGQQIRQLEEYLGQPLFRRSRGELSLTEAGRSLTPGLTDAFDRVLDALTRMPDARAVPIRVCAPSAFAAKWLVPRIAALRACLSDVQIVVAASAGAADSANAEADILIRFGALPEPEERDATLFAEEIAPVCSAAFADRHGLRERGGAVRSSVLLHDDEARDDRSSPDWSSWFEQSGLARTWDGYGLHFGQTGLAIEAALAGQGIALGRLRLVGGDLAAGRLVVPFGRSQTLATGYRLSVRPQRQNDPGVLRIAAWLRGEAARERTGPLAPRPVDEIGEGSQRMSDPAAGQPAAPFPAFLQSSSQ